MGELLYKISCLKFQVMFFLRVESSDIFAKDPVHGEQNVAQYMKSVYDEIQLAFRLLED